jgi:hypothetical protein
MSDDSDDLAALGHRVDGQLRDVDSRVDATRDQLDVLHLELSQQIDNARRDMGRLVLTWMWASTVITSGLCLATIVVVLLVD